MVAEIISIGEELLIGQTINTNASWLAQELNGIGIDVRRIVTITDDHNSILGVLEECLGRSQLVITTGGLGPTRDDMTKNVFCQYFGSGLTVNNQVREDNIQFFRKRGLDPGKANEGQSMVPDKADIIRNPYGTAPGLWFEENEKVVIALPGVPFEMKHMVSSVLIPRLRERIHDRHIVHRTVLTQGVGESFLSEIIADWEEALPKDLKLAYLPSPGIVKLRLSGRGNNRHAIEESIDNEINKLQKVIPQYIWGYDHDKLEVLLGKALTTSGLTLSTAESCTGGYIAHRITSVPGSSAYFKGSVVAYANTIKRQLLSVHENDLVSYGAVSREVVETMAANARILFDSDYALAVSGIAGPEGGSKNKPVGTVWIALSGPAGTKSKLFHFGDSRERNIIRASTAAMAMLYQHLNDM